MLKKDRVKLICLVLFIVAVASILLTNNGAIKTAGAFSSGPPAGRTGAPGELTCATTGCHGGTPNTGPGQLIIEAPRTYAPGQTYSINLQHATTDSSRRRWGFELTVLTTNLSKAGNLQRLNELVRILNDDGPGNDRQYIEHGAAGTFQGQIGGASWTFNWTAPATDVGPVTFYAAGNQANGDGTNNGDQIYITSVTVNPLSATTGPPSILNASVSGKRLIVLGDNFDIGATLLVNSNRVKKVSNDEDNPRTILVARKAGRDIERGQTVELQVRNADDTLSEPFLFTRP